MALRSRVSNSKYAKNLVQVEATRSISLEPRTWLATETEHSDSPDRLWLNLSDGYIGNVSACVMHILEMRSRGKEYPLLVKLDTLSSKEPHVASCDVTRRTCTWCRDPYLVKHLEHWGIKLGGSVKRKRGDSGLDKLPCKMFGDRKFTDAVLRCAGAELRVHRAVLAAASPVFEKMLSSQMREAEQAAICIEEVGPEVVQAMLCHIYTHQLQGNADLAQLFALATMYELDALAEAAGEQMLAGLDKSNVLDCCRVVRRHASSGSANAQALWDKLYAQLQRDPALLRATLELAVS